MAKKITASELDKKFDDGNEDVIQYFNKPFQKINVDMPVPMLKEIDAEADRLGINRQALIKVWLDDKLLSIKARRT